MAERLGLDAVAASVLAVCAAPELHPRFGRLYAYLHDDVTRPLASARLVVRLLEGPSEADVLAALAHTAPLRVSGAVSLLAGERPMPLAERPLKLADRLAGALLGAALEEAPQGGKLRRIEAPAQAPGRPGDLERLRGVLEVESRLPLIVAGPDAEALLAAALGRTVLVSEATDATDAAAMRSADLAAAVEGALLCFSGLIEVEPATRRRAVATLLDRPERLIVVAPTRDAAVALDEQSAVIIETGLPALGERREAWAAFSGTDDVDDVAAKFRLSVRQIADASEIARIAAAGRGEDVPTPADLDLGARNASSSRIGELAARLEPKYAWDDLVLPEKPLEVLRSVSSYVRHRDLVLGEWGYERSVAPDAGLKVMFAGEPGTGKTMAAQVIANELGLELYRIDLATVVSKYIGETEKNLDRVFVAADGLERDPLLRRGRRALRQALRGERRARPLRQHRGRLPAAEDGGLRGRGHAGHEPAPQHRRRVPAPHRLRDRLPVPRAGRPRAHLAQLLPEAAPLAGDVDLAFLAAQFELSGGEHPQRRAGGRVPGGRGRRRDRHAAPRARRRAGVREARAAHARVRLRALPRARARALAGARVGARPVILSRSAAASLENRRPDAHPSGQHVLPLCLPRGRY